MTRRHFIEEVGVAGIGFIACGLEGGVGGAQAQTRRREVVVNGKRVKTVDIHAHCAVPEAMALMNLGITGQPNLPQVLVMTKTADRLRAMDEQGIDVEALSINPYWYKADRDVAQKIIAISWPRPARPIRSASWLSPRWPCSSRTWRRSSWSRA
jgi:aminocarboxymuconate-semialdehyde decarboxylase